MMATCADEHAADHALLEQRHHAVDDPEGTEGVPLGLLLRGGVGLRQEDLADHDDGEAPTMIGHRLADRAASRP